MGMYSGWRVCPYISCWEVNIVNNCYFGIGRAGESKRSRVYHGRRSQKACASHSPFQIVSDVT